MNNSSRYYVSPSAPSPFSQQQPPPIGFQVLSTADPGINMSGYPQYPQQGNPSYPPASGYPSYPPSGAPSYPSTYPAPNQGYPQYPQVPVSSAPYGSNPYPPSGGMGGYPSSQMPGGAPYAQPSYTQSGYPSSASLGAGYPPSNQSMYPAMPSGYMSQPVQGGQPMYSSAQGVGQPPYQNYGQPQQQQQQGYPQQQPSAAPHSASSPYYPSAGSSPYGSSPAGGYNINQGTIVPYNPFNSKTDAEVLRKAMKGIGTDEKSIIRVLCNRTAAQRAQIALDYKTLFGKDLVHNLKDELSGNFEDVICALMAPRATYLAKCMYNAISGIGTAELTLVEILCTSTNAEIREINNTYKLVYKRSLENDLRSDTSGYFKRLLVSLNVGNRDENPTVNPGQAAQDAQRLYQAGEGRWGTEESVFNSILVSQSFSQLRVVFQEYERISHRTIEAALHNEMSGDLLDGMLGIVKCVRSRCAFFAERLRNSLKGAGTIDNNLIRIVVSRSEIDLKLIRDEYQRMYGRSLAQDISDDTGGDYKRVLLEIIK